MYMLNQMFLIMGIAVTILGIASFFIEGLTRFINSPGGPKFKAMICTVLGLVFLLLSIFIEMPIEGA